MAKRSKGTPRATLEQRASDILANSLILDLKNNRYRVESQSEPGAYYDVCFLDDRSCACPYHITRHSDCRHIVAVQMTVMKTEPLVPADFTMGKPEPRCTNKECGSANCEFYESRPRKGGGASDRYRGQKPVHIRTASVQNRHVNNSLIERQNGTVRNRIDRAGIQLRESCADVSFHHTLQLRPPAHGHKRQDARRSHEHPRGWGRQVGNASGVCVRVLAFG